MAIEFRCSQCNQLLRVPDDSAGKSARCPKCQSLMTVPAAGPPPPTGAVTSFSSPPPFSPPVPPPPKPPTEAAPIGSSPFAAPLSAPPPPNPYASSQIPAGYGPANPNQGPMLLAVGSLATAVMGLLSCACCLFMPFPPIALLLGVLALCQKPDQQARTIAIIGIVLSALCLILLVIGIIVGLAGPLLDPQFRQQLGK